MSTSKPGFGVAQRIRTPDGENETAVDPPTKLKLRVVLASVVGAAVVAEAVVGGAVVGGSVVGGAVVGGFVVGGLVVGGFVVGGLVVGGLVTGGLVVIGCDVVGAAVIASVVGTVDDTPDCGVDPASALGRLAIARSELPTIEAVVVE